MNITVAIVLDCEHLFELSRVLPGWLDHHPELLDCPWLFACDLPFVRERAEELMAGHGIPVARFVGWKEPPAGRPTWTHRELALWQYIATVPEHVETEHWLKIDTDAVAGQHPSQDGWRQLAGQAALVAPPWGYTKPPGTIAKLEQLLGHKMPHRTDGRRDRHPRVIGWWTLVTSAMARDLAWWCQTRTHELPVISHDTLLWALCKATGQKVLRVDMSPFGWVHHRGLDTAPPWQGTRHGRILLDLLPHPTHNRVLEVGAHQGHTSVTLASDPRVQLSCVDPWREAPPDSDWRRSGDSVASLSQLEHDAARLSCHAMLNGRARVYVSRGAEYAAEARRRGEQFELIFIDGAHDARSVAEDLRAFSPLVTGGGVFCGHDYSHRRFPGVKQEVDRWASEQGLTVQTHQATVWSVRMPS